MDDELLSPLHDEIMLWFDSNAERILSDSLPEQYTHNPEKGWEHFLTPEGREFSFGDDGLLTFTASRVQQKKWLFPEVNKKGEILDFVDIRGKTFFSGKPTLIYVEATTEKTTCRRILVGELSSGSIGSLP